MVKIRGVENFSSVFRKFIYVTAYFCDRLFLSYNKVVLNDRISIILYPQKEKWKNIHTSKQFLVNLQIIC